MEITDREREVYIQGTEGPYRGRVVDARTKEPIRGAVVVAAWYYYVYAVVESIEQFYDAIEVLTDDQGYFVVDAPNIERRAPSRTEFPVFTIFKPGFKYYRGWFVPVKEMAKRQAKPLLGVVELEPNVMKSKRERLRELPSRVSRIPDEKLPIFLKTLEDERERLLR